MYTVKNKNSGKVFNVDNSLSILDNALANGFNFSHNCKKGLCGQCMATIIAGEVKYDKITRGINEEDIANNKVLLCQSWAKSDVLLAAQELTNVAVIKTQTLACKIVKIKYLNADVIQLSLNILNNNRLLYLAGQYIDLIHPDFSPRSFSIANAPTNINLIELHIRLVPDGKFTNFIFNNLQKNALMQIEGPKGTFFLREGTRPIVFVAGGTGFGPIKAVVEHMIKIKLNRKIYIYWGVRDEADLYMDLPLKWAQSFANIKFIPVLSMASSNWQGRVGYVHNSVLEDFASLQDYEVYACGPPIMIESCTNAFYNIGLAEDSFFADSFEFAFNK